MSLQPFNLFNGTTQQILYPVLNPLNILTSETTQTFQLPSKLDIHQLAEKYSTKYPTDTLNYEKYKETIFDTASIGIYLLGMDPYHTNGEIVLGQTRKEWYFLDFTDHKFEWKVDDLGRRKPYVWNGSKWILINNLHVHSKQLQNGLSLPLDPY